MMPTMTSMRSLFAAVCAALLLAACGDGSLRDDLGLGRSSPDEFSVADRPPLSLPPDFELRPPQPGAARPQDVNLSQHASEVVFGSGNKPSAPSDTSTAAAVTDGSDVEKAVLTTAGAPNATPDIRTLVDREASEKVVSSPHLIDELLWWKKEPPTGVTVDAAAEAARIKEAKEKGQPLNQGATPIIERQKTGWLNL
jgi:hypothetical protein